MKKAIIFTIIISSSLLLTGYTFLINKSYVPERSSFQCDLDIIDKLCDDKSDLPIAVNTLTTAKGELLKWTMAAGDKSLSNQYIQTSFQIVYEDRTVILDAPMGEEQFNTFKNVYKKQFFKGNYHILQEAMKQSVLIIFTHEHSDHLGGLSKSSYLGELYKKVILTEEQYNSPKIEEADLPSIVFNKINPLKFENYYEAAPGIVMIKAPGHTQGHQMVYVHLQDGKKFLFTGDIVWNYENIVKLKNRPLLVTLAGGENRKQLGHQIRWLHDRIYSNVNLNINIVPSHDPEVIRTYVKEGLLGETFELPD
jgi:glyoxylase-like metal-dependent hydrolase (beta-lactamase superfamily II)